MHPLNPPSPLEIFGKSIHVIPIYHYCISAFHCQSGSNPVFQLLLVPSAVRSGVFPPSPLLQLAQEEAAQLEEVACHPLLQGWSVSPRACSGSSRVTTVCIVGSRQGSVEPIIYGAFIIFALGGRIAGSWKGHREQEGRTWQGLSDVKLSVRNSTAPL